MASSRLATFSQLLADLYEDAPEERRRNAALAVCEAVVARVEVDEDLLAIVRRNLVTGAADEMSIGRLNELAAKFDATYANSKERESGRIDKEALRQFSQARLATALAIALDEKMENLDDSLYESLTAIDDPRDIVQLAEKRLS